jgi:hypothetical protein
MLTIDLASSLAGMQVIVMLTLHTIVVIADDRCGILDSC